jgi:hypothetical protein
MNSNPVCTHGVHNFALPGPVIIVKKEMLNLSDSNF